MTTWMLDGNINLSDAVKRADLHLATTIENLQAAGLGRREAETFANFIISEECVERGGDSDFDPRLT